MAPAIEWLARPLRTGARVAWRLSSAVLYNQPLIRIALQGEAGQAVFEKLYPDGQEESSRSARP